MTGTRLSHAQRLIVEYDEGPLLVVAGPGSGKTRVLTERVRRLLTTIPGHFRVLALTFTNKAANEMIQRLEDLGDERQRAFIGTLHGFCLDILADRGRAIGVHGHMQIFERFQDRRQVLLEAVASDPVLASELTLAGDAKARARRLDEWIRAIGDVKAHPVTRSDLEPLEARLLEAYDAGLRACGAYDFDDLLILAHRLLTESPSVADFYRRLYRYVCIDEAQDLNEAQYAVIRVLCGDEFRNVMMVGDPKQSIYGFNTSSPKYLEQFEREFGAQKIELTENFRSARAVVHAAQQLQPSYAVEGQLPIAGEIQLLVGRDEACEAAIVVDTVEQLVRDGHPDIEGECQLSKCAILGRTRFALLAVESELKNRGVAYYKRLSASHENESTVAEDFLLGLRIIGNPKDRLHLAALGKRWESVGCERRTEEGQSGLELLAMVQESAREPRSVAVLAALNGVVRSEDRVDLMAGVAFLRKYADTLGGAERTAIYEDTEVIAREWDQYLRAGKGSTPTVAGFLSNVALGTTQQATKDGVALLTVHSAKGLEFDVVFIVGMVKGVFPDYRANGKREESAEEQRNMFVAVTRSKRLLFLSYPESRRMPWGDEWACEPSPYLRTVGLV